MSTLSSVLKGIFSGIILTICIFSRLPTASLLLVPILCLFFLDRPIRKFLFLQLGCCLLSIVGMLLIMYYQGILPLWIEALTQRGSTEFSNTSLLLHRYVATGVITLKTNITSIFLFSVTLLVISTESKSSVTPFQKTLFLLSFLGLLSLLLYLNGLSIYFCLLLLMCILLYWNKKRLINLDKTDTVAILLAFVLPLCLLLGSNSGMYRIYMLAFFPIIVTGAILQKYVCRSSNNTLSVFKQCMMIVLAAAAVLYSTIRYTIFRDVPIYKCCHFVHDGKFSGMYTGMENQEFLSDCMTGLPSIVGNDDFYAYPNAAIYYYILNKKPLQNFCWDSIMGKQARDHHLTRILNSAPPFIIRNYYFDQVPGYTADPAEFDERIIQSGKYNIVYQTKYYVVYKRNGK